MSALLGNKIVVVPLNWVERSVITRVDRIRVRVGRMEEALGN